MATPTTPAQLAASSVNYLALPHPYQTLMSSRTMFPATRHAESQRAQRMKFLLFIKILFKRLDESGDTSLRTRAKYLLAHIINERSKIGDPKYNPLLDSLETQLRELVGEAHWRRSHGYMRYYMARKNKKQETPQASRPAKKRPYHEISHAA